MVAQHTKEIHLGYRFSLLSPTVNCVFVRAVLNGNLVVILCPLCVFAPKKEDPSGPYMCYL